MLKLLSLYMFTLSLLACSNLNPLLDKQVEKKQAARINLRLAMIYLDRQDVLHAKQKIILAQQQAPSDPVVGYTTAYFYEYVGNRAMADSWYLRTLKLAPGDGATHNNYGAFLCRQKRYHEAVDHFLMAAYDPNYLNDAAAFHNAALCRTP